MRHQGQANTRRREVRKYCSPEHRIATRKLKMDEARPPQLFPTRRPEQLRTKGSKTRITAALRHACRHHATRKGKPNRCRPFCEVTGSRCLTNWSPAT